MGLRYLDTGAMFRAVTWWMLEQQIDVHDPAAVAARVGEGRLESGTDPLAPTITMDGVDVSAAIREAAVTGAVSPVSAVPEVRSWLLREQRRIVGEGGIVVEGRDIGSVVCPDAELKIYLTADPAARAARRAQEQGGGDVKATQESLLKRDAIDSTRATAPLTMPAGAVHIDTTDLTLEEVIGQIVGLADSAMSGEATSVATDGAIAGERR